jgi:hypothetical protein
VRRRKRTMTSPLDETLWVQSVQPDTGSRSKWHLFRKVYVAQDPRSFHHELAEIVLTACAFQLVGDIRVRKFKDLYLNADVCSTCPGVARLEVSGLDLTDDFMTRRHEQD